MRIAVSKASGSYNYENYGRWLRSAGEDIHVVDCSLIPHDELASCLDDCDGLLLCGGPDVEPARYGRSAGDLPCTTDPDRDAYEFRLIDLAIARSMPILGICRGMQILNVHGGGTLTIDIPSQIAGALEHAAQDGDALHHVEVHADSVLRKVTRCTEGQVNSAHHQAVDVLAPQFIVTATAADGIPEAMENQPDHGSSFIMAVQWHPERMDHALPLSKNILHTFVFECDSYRHLLHPSLQRRSAAEPQG